MTKKKKILVSFIMFTGVNGINAAIPFLLLPILTKYLLPEEYIIIDIFQNLSLFFMPIIGLNVLGSVERFYFDRDFINLPVYISTGIFFSLFTLIGFLAVYFLVDYNHLIPTIGDFPNNLIYWVVVYSFFTLLIEVQLSIWRVQVKPFLYGGLRIGKTIIDLALSYFLIVNLNWDWEGRVFGMIVSTLVIALVAIITLRRNQWLALSYRKEYVYQGISFSGPLILHTLSAFIIGFSDRIFVLEMVNSQEAGIYSVAYQIGMVMSLIQNSFNQVWAPHTFKVMKSESESGPVELMKANYLYAIIIFLLVPIITFLLPYIYSTFIGSSYQSGINIVFWVLLGYAFNGIYRMLVNYLIYIKKTKLIAFNTVLSAISNLVLNYYFISKFGVIGAAFATTVSFALLFLLTLRSVTKYFKLPWSLK